MQMIFSFKLEYLSDIEIKCFMKEQNVKFLLKRNKVESFD